MSTLYSYLRLIGIYDDRHVYDNNIYKKYTFS
jgi:hypothetical protein